MTETKKNPTAWPFTPTQSFTPSEGRHAFDDVAAAAKQHVERQRAEHERAELSVQHTERIAHADAAHAAAESTRVALAERRHALEAAAHERARAERAEALQREHERHAAQEQAKLGQADEWHREADRICTARFFAYAKVALGAAALGATCALIQDIGDET